MQIERLEDSGSVASRAADLLAQTVTDRPGACLLLPAGNTPLPLFAELVRRSRDGSLDLSRTHLFQLDELVGVAGDDERSFQSCLRTHLLDALGQLGRNGAHDHLLDGTDPDPEGMIRAHSDRLKELGPPATVVLGLGTNGHVAFNEPGSTRADGARAIQLAETTRRAMASAFPDESPRRGVTLGLADLFAGDEIILLVTGASKAGILRRIVEEEPSSDIPASLLRAHDGLRILADQEACAELAAPA